jgi:hypothetical protein
MSLDPSKRLFAVIENNTVINTVTGVEEKVVEENPGKYIEYTHGWLYPEGIDGSTFFPLPTNSLEE